MMTSTLDPTEQVVQLALTSWESRNSALTEFMNKYNDAAYMQEVSPGRNRAIYLFGHLIAANDALFPLFGFGKRQYPELEQIFSKNPDKAVENLPSIADLKKAWESINKQLSGTFKAMTAEEWIDRHTAVSEEDFQKEPHRNKLNALLGRTNHLSYHLGQLNLLSVN
jgi:hypothetical protein